MCVDLGCPSISNIYFLAPSDNIEHGLRLSYDDVIYILELHSEWKVFCIIIYVETGILPLNMRGKAPQLFRRMSSQETQDEVIGTHAIMEFVNLSVNEGIDEFVNDRANEAVVTTMDHNR